jgi:hypothetical protein
MANKSSQQKVTRSGQVYGNEPTVAEDTPALPTETGTPSVTRSGEVYEKPAIKGNTPTTNDIKNTPEFKKARAKYDDKQYDNLTDDQKDRLAEKDVEDAASALNSEVEAEV